MDYVNMNVIVVVILTNSESKNVNNFYYDIFFFLDYEIGVFYCYYGNVVTVILTYLVSNHG